MTRCFISYSHSPFDQVAVRFLVDFLEKRGIASWWDERLEATGGEALNAEIAGAIMAADIVVVLASSQSLASRYCRGEVSFAIEHDKRLIRIDIERVATPPAVLPLAAARTVAWYGTTQAEAEQRLAGALRAEGFSTADTPVAGTSAFAGKPATLSFLDDPDAAVIRPTYAELKAAGPDRSREYAARMTRAATFNPANGFNNLSLAFIWLFLGDGHRALESARAATVGLPREPNAHYAEALALCAASDPNQRTRAEVEDVLRKLAIARRLPNAGAHIDVLSATVIANYYLPRFATPPVQPDALLRQALEQSRPIDPDECRRAWSVEPVRAQTSPLSAELIAKFGL